MMATKRISSSSSRSSSSSTRSGKCTLRDRSFRGREAFFIRAVATVAMAAGLASALGPDIPSDYTVVYANVVMRHGQRSRLAKSVAAEFGNNDGVALTAEGEEQCYELGEQLRVRYIEQTDGSDNTTTKIRGLSEFYDADRFQIVSSGYDRTLESAASLLLALYPPGQSADDVERSTLLWENFIIVPIHSSDPENDARILASDKCPVYTDNWVEFYRTDEFVQKEADAAEWISRVYGEFESGRNAQNTPNCFVEVEALEENKLQFHAPYNLWDCASVYAADGEEQAVDYIDVAGVPETSSAATGFDYLEELVNWIEDRKYEQSMVRRMVGGLWITDMFNRFKQVVTHMRDGESDTSGRFPGMHITVGHYPTLKGIAGALDIGGLDGIPPYAAHFSFELLYNSTADYSAGEEDFGVRIMYQKDQNASNLKFIQMTPVFDDENSLDLDDGLASTRDPDTGIMGWSLFSYLMEHQLAGEQVYYSEGEEEWCLDCLAIAPDTCLGMELDRMTLDWESQVAAVEALERDLADAGDKVEGHHVALLSIFGMILGIGIGLCIRPCLDRCAEKTAKVDQRTITDDSGLESWPTSGRSNGHTVGAITGTASGNGNANGSFRLGVKTPTARHVLGGANGQRGMGVRAMAVPTTDEEDAKIETDIDSATTRIPHFAPTSILGEPVPFPHRRQPSGMTGVDSRMMTGVDGDHGDYNPSLTHSATPQATTTIEDGIEVDQSSGSTVQLT